MSVKQTVTALVEQYRADLARDNRADTGENRRAWLWFICPAHLRAEVAPALGPLPCETRTENLRLRVTPTEHAALREAASENGETIAAYIRRRCEL